MCRNKCVRPTVRRVFRHLVALFFFAHILLLVRITSYAIFISIPISISFACCQKESRSGGGGERASAQLNLCCVFAAAQSTSSSSSLPAVHLRRCLELHLHLLASLLLCLSLSLFLALHLTDASFPSSAFCLPTAVLASFRFSINSCYANFIGQMLLLPTLLLLLLASLRASFVGVSSSCIKVAQLIKLRSCCLVVCVCVFICNCN